MNSVTIEIDGNVTKRVDNDAEADLAWLLVWALLESESTISKPPYAVNTLVIALTRLVGDCSGGMMDHDGLIAQLRECIQGIEYDRDENAGGK